MRKRCRKRRTNWDVSEISKMVAPGTPALLEE